jgi:uncharacterized protein YlxP (DUF503 family)
MPVGIIMLEIHLPHAHSLKEKRVVMRKLQYHLRARFNVSVAELDHQDLWQRAVIGVAVFSLVHQQLESVLQKVESESERVLGGDLIGPEWKLY